MSYPLAGPSHGSSHPCPISQISTTSHPVEMESKAKIITCLFFAVVLDLFIAPGAAVLILVACARISFNPRPEDIKTGKTPILLVHGSGFNDIEWLIGRQFLKKDSYGSVFSMNYDGLFLHNPSKGIDDYACNEISEEVKKIKQLTSSEQIIMIGHSMGGLIAGYYAEFCAERDQVLVEHVFTIASPWQGTPLIDFIHQIPLKNSKRYQQMSVKGEGSCTEKGFRQRLVAKAKESEERGLRRYYNIFSGSDIMVPKRSGELTESHERKQIFNALGHYAIIIHPSVWLQIRKWLNEIYT